MPPGSQPSEQHRGESFEQHPGGQQGETSTPVYSVSQENPHQFSIGSTVELQSEPPRYGVMKWIGSIPNIQGRIAGVELVSIHACIYS